MSRTLLQRAKHEVDNIFLGYTTASEVSCLLRELITEIEGLESILRMDKSSLYIRMSLGDIHIQKCLPEDALKYLTVADRIPDYVRRMAEDAFLQLRQRQEEL